MLKPAETTQDIHPLLRQRWSPLAFAETPVPPAILLSLFEAARWSSSSFNEQPWRFIVGAKDGEGETYQKILETLVPGNQVWAGTAPVLILESHEVTSPTTNRRTQLHCTIWARRWEA